jgi:rhomboid protease GluP
MWQAEPMRKSGALLRTAVDEREATRIVVLLAAMGIDATLEHDASGRVDVFVAPAEHDAAARLLAEQAADDDAGHAGERFAGAARTGDDPSLGAPQGWLGRGTWAVVTLMAGCVAMFMIIQDGATAGSRSRMLELGAIDYARIRAGEYWRFLTAVFLHFDVPHLLSNLSVMLIVAPPLAHQVGALRFVLVFLVSGVGANVVSHLLSPIVGLKAGASGAIAGVLGALGGVALRPGRPTRFRSWQRLGALAAIYGLLIGFGPGRDNLAHLAGLAIGLALGRFTAPLEDESSRLPIVADSSQARRARE